MFLSIYPDRAGPHSTYPTGEVFLAHSRSIYTSGIFLTYQSFNPATGRLVKSFSEITDAEFEKKIANAASCYQAWRHKSYAERAVIVAKAAAILTERVERPAFMVYGDAAAVCTAMTEAVRGLGAPAAAA